MDSYVDSELEIKKILVVDDMGSMRSVVREFLYEGGFNNITLAEDGERALQILNEKKIDLIISDWDMPKVTGLELLKTVKIIDKFKDIPFIMLTANNNKKHVYLAIKAGVNDYIAKPFKPEQLLQKVQDNLVQE